MTEDNWELLISAKVMVMCEVSRDGLRGSLQISADVGCVS